MNRQARALELLARLKRRYPNPQSELDWSTPWELLAATMLSAQCTDVRVNKVTPELFRRWPGPPSMAQADPAEVQAVIHSAGFFRQKTKNLIGEATLIMEEYAGEVPRTMKDLTRLPGVARKTANIVLACAFGIQEGVAVDTHVKRLAYRLGLTDETDVKKIEQDLMKLFPRPDWGNANHMLVLFGRQVCPARSPRCNECELTDICPKCGVKTK
ncbi:MAG: endonuclease III [Proteobacteria bacterium]|nr:endonuclease III [Pseudomonadota bacterium]